MTLKERVKIAAEEIRRNSWGHGYVSVAGVSEVIEAAAREHAKRALIEYGHLLIISRGMTPETRTAAALKAAEGEV